MSRGGGEPVLQWKYGACQSASLVKCSVYEASAQLFEGALDQQLSAISAAA